MGAGHAGRPLVRHILRRLAGVITADLGAGRRAFVRDIRRRLPLMYPAYIPGGGSLVRNVGSSATFVVHLSNLLTASLLHPHTRVTNVPVESARSRKGAPAK